MGSLSANITNHNSFLGINFSFENCLPLILLSFIVFIVIGIILFLIIQKNYKRKIIALEQRLLLSQMNPHFVFNSLTAIQSYIFRNEPYQAGKYLANFSKLVRSILENSRQEFITISMENETIKHYLELQALRFDGKFDYNIEISPDIDMEHHLIPPMLGQPFIENAIEHGIIHLSTRGRIVIRFHLNPPNITLEVEDNGVGIEKSTELGENRREKHKSLATKITKERLRNLRKVYHSNVTMEIIDLSKLHLKSKVGTLVRFQIPITIK